MFDIRRSVVDVRSLPRRRSALRPQAFLMLDLMIPTQQVLGLRFFNGDVNEAVAFMHRHGGYLVAPSGTCFARLREDEPYRCAMLSADLAIADSGLMVLAWRLLRHEKIQRISGLKYLKQLLAKLEREGGARIFWILPGTRARQKLLDCFRTTLPVKTEDCYVAPRYELEIEDRNLLALVEQRRPAHIVIAIGSGPQEKLGHYLCENLSYRPAIHCTGAALGFITGDQVAIPDWADRFFLGWLLRLIARPHRFVPRLIRGFELPWLIARYGNALPPLRSRNQKSELPPSPRLRRNRQ
jgi:exopolysaccharide biosynthesis WecB/TagA/CpsF family protein